MGKRRYLIDVDTGADDAVALLMALRSRDVEVAGVTVVAGNVGLETCVANTLRVLDLAEAAASVPVARGADRALIQRGVDAKHVHGDDGLCGFPAPPSARALDPRPAAQFVAESLIAADEPVTVVALAPPTNLALALLLRPEIAAMIDRLVVMGGSGDGTGNATAAAEFNIAADPEAAWIVLNAGMPTTLVGLDACRPTAMPVGRAAEFRDSPNARLRYLACMLDFFASRLGRERVPIYDAVAMAVALRPELAETRRLPLQVELAAGHHRGAVLTDRRTFDVPESGWPRADVVTRVDRAGYESLMLELLG